MPFPGQDDRGRRAAGLSPSLAGRAPVRSGPRHIALHCEGIGVKLGIGPTVSAERAMRTRREVLAATAAALVMPRVAFAEGDPPKPKQLIFNASGGSQIASLRENYLNDFEKETGIKIVD